MDARGRGRAQGRARGRARGREGRFLPIRGRGIQNGRPITELNFFIKRKGFNKRQVSLIESGLQEAVEDLGYPLLIGRWKGRFVHYLDGESALARTRSSTKRRVVGKETVVVNSAKEKADECARLRKARKKARESRRPSGECVEVRIQEASKSDHVASDSDDFVDDTDDFVNGNGEVPEGFVNGNGEVPEGFVNDNGEGTEGFVNGNDEVLEEMEETVVVNEVSEAGLDTHSTKEGPTKDPDLVSKYKEDNVVVETEKAEIQEHAKAMHVATDSEDFMYDSEDFMYDSEGFVNGNGEGTEGFVNGNDEVPDWMEKMVVSEAGLETQSTKEGPAEDPDLVSKYKEDNVVVETEEAEIQEHDKTMHVDTDELCEIQERAKAMRAKAMRAKVREKQREAEKFQWEHFSALDEAGGISDLVKEAERVLITAKEDLLRANDALNAAKAAKAAKATKEARSQPAGKGRSGGRKRRQRTGVSIGGMRGPKQHSSKPTQSTTAPRNNPMVEDDDDVDDDDDDDVVAVAKEAVTAREEAVTKAEEALKNRKDAWKIADDKASFLESAWMLAEENAKKLHDEAKKATYSARIARNGAFQVRSSTDATRFYGELLETGAKEANDDWRYETSTQDSSEAFSYEVYEQQLSETVANEDNADSRPETFTHDTSEKTPIEENEEIFKALFSLAISQQLSLSKKQTRNIPDFEECKNMMAQTFDLLSIQLDDKFYLEFVDSWKLEGSSATL